MLSFDEAEMLTTFVSRCPATANVLIFDGAYVTTPSFTAEVDMVIARDSVSDEIVPLEMKSWADAVQPEVLPHAALRRGAIVDSSAAVPVTQNCLLHAFSCVMPETNMELLAAQLPAADSLCAMDLNQALAKMAGANAVTCLTLSLIDMAEVNMRENSNAIWLCHQGNREGHGHWWAAVFPTTGGIVLIDAWSQGRCLWLSFSDFQALMEDSDNIACYELIEHNILEAIPTTSEYKLYGSGPRPACAPSSLAPEKTKLFTRKKSCIECGGPLAPDQPIDARVYTLAGVEAVEHVPMRCAKKSCRTYHHYNYRWVDGRKMNTCQSSELDYIFLNSKTGFSSALVASITMR